MTTQETKTITVSTQVNANATQVWKFWTSSEHIIKWNSPSPDWHSPCAEHDFKQGGKFNIRMEAKDGSLGFDFQGVYNIISLNKYIEYTIEDGRKVKITFEEVDGKTFITENFEAETTNSLEVQQGGWQAILDSFKRYVESKNK